jgi:hypothetical protein
LWNWLNSHLVSGTLLCECARLGGLGPRTHTYTCSHVKFGDSFFGVGAKHLRSMNNGSSRFGSALCCNCGWKEGECYLVSMWMGGMYTWVLSMLVHGTIENMDENCMIDRWKKYWMNVLWKWMKDRYKKIEINEIFWWKMVEWL